MGPQMSRLLSAAEQGNLFMVTALLDKGNHVDSTDEEGVSALHAAAANGNETVVRLLLSRGASLEARTNYGWTALMLASYYGHFMVCWILLQHKSNIHSQNELGSTALDCAARSGHVQLAALLIEAGAQANISERRTPGLSLTALMNAAQHGHEGVLKLLLEKGADVNYRQETTGWTALMLASLNGHMTAAQILVEFGADTNILNVDDRTALQIAADRQKTEVQGFLDERTTARPQLKGQKVVRPSIIEAARSGDLACVKHLLDQGDADVNSTDEDGATPLMYASMGGHFPVVQLLIERGADIDSQAEISAWTALMQATYYGHKAVAKLLIDSGADVNIQANNGCTAFDMATIIGNTEMLRLLASVSMQFPATPKRYYSSSSFSNGTRGDGLQSSFNAGSKKDMSSIDSDMAVHTGVKNWWSKMSNRFRNLNIGRTLRVPSSSKLRLLGSAKSMESLVHRENAKNQKSDSHLGDGSAVTVRSLASVVTDSAFQASGRDLKKHHSLAIGSPMARLPDDVITPVLPPPFPSPAFELTRIQRQQHNGDTEDQSTPQGQVPSLYVNGEFIPDVHELCFDDSLDNISSISGYPSHGPLMSPIFNRGVTFTGSPESSYSTASFYSSTSNNSGSRTLKAPSSPAADSPFHPVSAVSSSLWQKKTGKGYITPSPTASAPPADIVLLQKKLQHSSLQGHVDDTDEQLSSSWSRNRYPYKNAFDCNEDDLEDILKKLSLEKYHPIFEEQEVDMEAFLTMSDGDLSELGVTRKDARQQILTAIAELNCGKDRERQHLQESLSTYHSSKSHVTSGYSSISPSTSTSLTQWPLKHPP